MEEDNQKVDKNGPENDSRTPEISAVEGMVEVMVKSAIKWGFGMGVFGFLYSCFTSTPGAWGNALFMAMVGAAVGAVYAVMDGGGQR